MHGEDSLPERLSLAVPPGTEHIGTVRAFMGSVGAHYGLTPEQIDDLKLAVSEVCGEAIESPTDGRIRVGVTGTDGVLEIEVTGIRNTRSEESVGEDPARAFRWRLIDALIPDATFTPTEDGMAVRFTIGASG